MTHEELTLNIEKALEEIRPFLNSDGGDIKLVSIDGEKHVKVRFEGNKIGCSVNQMTLKAGVETTIKNNFTDNMSFLDLSFMFSDKFNIQVQSERYFFGNLDKNSNQYYFLDLEGRYVVKENKLTLFLSGNNLFNTETFKNYSVSDINISKTEYRLQPRYVLLKMEYRF